MRERPLLFSGPMVRAILDGRKTVTRRVVKPQPAPGNGTERWTYCVSSTDRASIDKFTLAMVSDDGSLYTERGRERELASLRCPYGQPGDRLWVKETWRTAATLDALSPSAIGERALDAGFRVPWAPVEYAADGARENWGRDVLASFGTEAGKTRVSSHMPRWASRLTLEVVSVRVERLHDITEEDAKAEGVTLLESIGANQRLTTGERFGDTPHRCAFAVLWEGINGAGSWDSNPWVWCVEFRRVTP